LCCIPSPHIRPTAREKQTLSETTTTPPSAIKNPRENRFKFPAEVFPPPNPRRIARHPHAATAHCTVISRKIVGRRTNYIYVRQREIKLGGVHACFCSASTDASSRTSKLSSCKQTIPHDTAHERHGSTSTTCAHTG